MKMLKRGQKWWQEVSYQMAACQASLSSAGSVWLAELRKEMNATRGLNTALLGLVC